MMRTLCLLCLVFSLGQVNPAVAADKDLLVFRANIDALAFLDDDRPALPPGVIDLSSKVSATITVIEVYIGEMRKDDKAIVMRIGGIPAGNKAKDVLFVAKRKSDGSLRAGWWDYSRHGQCIPEQFAAELGLADELSEIYRAGRLRCPVQATGT
ncbi:MAG: hypothetical protein ACJ8GW_17980 [Massilia sp.]